MALSDLKTAFMQLKKILQKKISNCYKKMFVKSVVQGMFKQYKLVIQKGQD